MVIHEGISVFIFSKYHTWVCFSLHGYQGFLSWKSPCSWLTLHWLGYRPRIQTCLFLAMVRVWFLWALPKLLRSLTVSSFSFWVAIFDERFRCSSGWLCGYLPILSSWRFLRKHWLLWIFLSAECCSTYWFHTLFPGGRKPVSVELGCGAVCDKVLEKFPRVLSSPGLAGVSPKPL